MNVDNFITVALFVGDVDRRGRQRGDIMPHSKDCF